MARTARRTRTKAKPPWPAAGPAAETPIDETVFSILDTETTGLSAKQGGRVCELALLKVKGGEKLGMYQTLIDPRVPIEAGARAVHGIDDSMVAGKPRFVDLSGELADRLKGTVMVCHNASFDRGFLEHEFGVAGRTFPEIPVLCTLRIARRHFEFSRNSLGVIAQELEIAPTGWA